MIMPEIVAMGRRQICAQCPSQCELFKSGQQKPEQPCVTCATGLLPNYGHDCAKTETLVIKFVVRNPGAVLNCIHRGAEIRQEQCTSCSGMVKAKICACAIFGECTLFSKPIPGVKACAGCDRAE